MMDGPRTIQSALEYAFVAAAKMRQPVYITGEANGYSVDIVPNPDAVAMVTAFGPGEPSGHVQQ